MMFDAWINAPIDARYRNRCVVIVPCLGLRASPAAVGLGWVTARASRPSRLRALAALPARLRIDVLVLSLASVCSGAFCSGWASIIGLRGLGVARLRPRWSLRGCAAALRL